MNQDVSSLINNAELFHDNEGFIGNLFPINSNDSQFVAKSNIIEAIKNLFLSGKLILVQIREDGMNALPTKANDKNWNLIESFLDKSIKSEVSPIDFISQFFSGELPIYNWIDNF